MKYLTVLLFWLVSSWSLASSTFRPAIIENGPEVLSKVRLPHIENGSETVILCSGFVRTTKDHFFKHSCFTKDRGISEISKQLDKQLGEELRIFPAMLNGEEAEVVLQYSVRIRKSARRQNIQLLQNHSAAPDLSSSGYIGAQRILQNSERLTCHACTRGVPLLMAVEVDELGNVRDVEIRSSGVGKTCGVTLAGFLLEQKFIPAHQDSRPVLSTTIVNFGRKNGPGTGEIGWDSFYNGYVASPASSHCRVF